MWSLTTPSFPLEICAHPHAAPSEMRVIRKERVRTKACEVKKRDERREKKKNKIKEREEREKECMLGIIYLSILPAFCQCGQC